MRLRAGCRHSASRETPAGENPIDATTLLGALKSCKTSDVEKARGFYRSSANIRVACALVRMFSRCGSMPEAREVFDSMPRRDIKSWNELHAGYVESNHPDLALAAFSAMDSPAPDDRSIMSAMTACLSLAAGEESKKVDDNRELKVSSLQQGVCIHKRASELGLEKNIFVGNTMIDMYVKCGDLLQARRVSRPTLVSWNVLLLGYAENGLTMQRRMFSPDSRMFSARAKACAKLARRIIEAEFSAAASSGCLLDSDVFLTSAHVLEVWEHG